MLAPSAHLPHTTPQVDKPNKAEHDAAVTELTNTFEALKEERRKLQEEIDAKMNDPASKSALTDLRAQMNELKTKRNALIAEKKAMRDQMDANKNQTDKLIKDKKDTRSNIKFQSIDEINKQIAKLQHQQETTTMSLTEEKKLIKEMDALMASKSLVANLQTADGALDQARAERKTLSERLSAKDKEIDAVTKETDGVMAKIKAINEKDSTKRDAIKELFTKRDALRAQTTETLKKKDAIRDEYREKNNAWYNYQRAVRAKKKLEWEADKKKREEEEAAYQAILDAEEAKKIPYEAEQALCDYLADYLERTYLSADVADAKDDKKDDKIEVKDDPFKGMKPVGKKDEDEEYFGKGKGKKKRVRATKKQDTGAGPFTLSVDSFEQFGLLSLSPPTSIEQVANSVKELREKKEWYKQQPRGSVPTAAEIRRANEKAAAKVKSSDAEVKPAKKSGAFSLSNDDFAPLGQAGAAASVNSSWGKSAPAAQEAL